MATPDQRWRDLARLRRVRDRLDRDFAQPLDLATIARDGHLSEGHLSRQFRAAYGESVHAYLMTRRIERAMALLRASDRSVTEISLEVGFSSLGTFSTRFRELVGVSPSAYRAGAAPTSTAVGRLPACVVRASDRPVRRAEVVRNGEARPWTAP